jgi:hypothetical protein
MIDIRAAATAASITSGRPCWRMRMSWQR